jgi:hypothetical protein
MPEAKAKTKAAAPAEFTWDDLVQYKAEGRFLDGYPPDQRSFFSPRDSLHPLLASLIGSAQHSLVLNMFGYDDDELDQLILSRNAVIASELRAVLDLNHDWMLKQMADAAAKG